MCVLNTWRVSVLGPGSLVLPTVSVLAAPAAAQTAAPAAKPFSVSLVGGLNSATMSTPLPEIIDVRYTHGLVNVAQETGLGGDTIKHRVISLMGGWTF